MLIFPVFVRCSIKRPFKIAVMLPKMQNRTDQWHLLGAIVMCVLFLFKLKFCEAPAPCN